MNDVYFSNNHDKDFELCAVLHHKMVNSYVETSREKMWDFTIDVYLYICVYSYIYMVNGILFDL